MATATTTRNGHNTSTNIDVLKRLGFAEAFTGNDNRLYVTGYRVGRVAIAVYNGQLHAFVLDAFDRVDRVYPAYTLEGCRIELTELGYVRLVIGTAQHVFDNAKLVARWLNARLPRKFAVRLSGSVQLPNSAERELIEYASRTK